MSLTKGELVQVLGRTVEKVGEKLDDPETPDKITKEELVDLLRETAMDAYAEFVD